MISSQKITVVMATHNGAPTLPLTLEALKRVEAPAAGLEIIAVDNASSDGTRDLLARAAAELLGEAFPVVDRHGPYPAPL